MAKYPLSDGPPQVDSEPPAAVPTADRLQTDPIPEQREPVINMTEPSRYTIPKNPKFRASSKNPAVAQIFGRRQEPGEQHGKNPKMVASSKNPIVATLSDPGTLLRRAIPNAGLFGRGQVAASSTDTDDDSGRDGTTTGHKTWNPISFKTVGVKYLASSKNKAVKAAYGRRQATPPSFPPRSFEVAELPPPPVLSEKPKGIRGRNPAVAARYGQGEQGD
ncbi:MAG: hypothetical protein Q9201_003278 [Fulgogasparrea decipioides]